MNIQKKITNIQNLAKEKNILQKEIVLGLSMLLSSSLVQALELTKPDDMEQSFKHENINDEIEKIKSETDLQEFNSKINSLLSKEGTSFQETFNQIFEDLLTKYIEELKKI